MNEKCIFGIESLGEFAGVWGSLGEYEIERLEAWEIWKLRRLLGGMFALSVLMGWSVGQFVGWLVSWLVGQLRLIDWFIGRTNWLVAWTESHLAGRYHVF